MGFGGLSGDGDCIRTVNRRQTSSSPSRCCLNPSDRLYHESHNRVFSLFARGHLSYALSTHADCVECVVCENRLEVEVEGSVPSGMEEPVPLEVTSSVSEAIVQNEEDCGRDTWFHVSLVYFDGNGVCQE